jgi:hypothetical protein
MIAGPSGPAIIAFDEVARSGALECLGAERAGEEGSGHGAELLVCVAGTGAEEVERGVHLDATALREHALGLLDDDAAVQRALELVVHQTCFANAAFLEEADGGDICERLTDLDPVWGQRGRARGEDVDRSDDLTPESHRQGVDNCEAEPPCLLGELEPLVVRRRERLIEDRLTGAVTVEARAFLVLELEQLEQMCRLLGRCDRT